MHVSHRLLRIANRLAVVIALLVVGLLALDRRYGILEHEPGGEAFDLNEQPYLMALFAIGAIIALRWKLIGATIVAFTAAGLIVFASQQLETFGAALVITGFVLPALLWLLVGIFRQRDLRIHRERGETTKPTLERRDVLQGLGLLGVASLAGVTLARYLFDRIYGPTHPESAVPAVVDSPTRWVWVGAVTDSTATVVTRLEEEDDSQVAELHLSTAIDLSAARIFPTTLDDRQVARVAVDGLEPDTRYHYAFTVDGVSDVGRRGTFITAPVGPSSFGVALASCARTGSNGQVFDAIRSLDPQMFVFLGDFHYGDIVQEQPPAFRRIYDHQLGQPAQSALFQAMAVTYIWDDHDWGGPIRDVGGINAVSETYRRYVPHYPIQPGTSPIYQAFSIGRVRFIMTDARAGRILPTEIDEGTLLGAAQKAWLIDELLAAPADHALTVWVNPVPWISAELGGDDWNGYASERAEIADVIADNDLARSLCMVSGDAHMVAIDDGTNSDYSTAQSGGFPVLQAAALDRPGSMKGGPYSNGAFPGGGQFGFLDVDDPGDGELRVTITGNNWRNEILTSHSWTIEA